MDDHNLAIHLLMDICVVYSFWLLWILWIYLSCRKHRLGGLKNRHLFFHSPGGWKSQAKVLTALFSDKDSFPGLQPLVFSLCPHKLIWLLPYVSRDLLCLSASYKDTRPTGLGSHSDDLRTLKVLYPNMVTLGVRL